MGEGGSAVAVSRQRRTSREPAFGSDSFLDVVANLVGIVLIIIVLVGARVRELPLIAAVESTAPALVLTADAETPRLAAELERLQAELERLQARLLALLGESDAVHKRERVIQSERDAVRRRQASYGKRQDELEETRRRSQADLEAERRSLAERLAELQRAIRELEALPPEQRTLRYHLPVSRPVDAGELLFECRGGRVTFIDLNAFLDQVKQSLSTSAEALRGQWEVNQTTRVVGAFQMKYIIARERTTGLDRTQANLPPTEQRGFGYGLDSWEITPVLPVRGEPLAEALAGSSDFLRIVNGLDPDQAVLTFFVYPDSFGLFRRLRDHLYDQGFVVVGRPLQMDQPIRGSRRGSVSQGQ
jgi:hypothetical protein